MSYEPDRELFELYNGNLLIPEIILNDVKCVMTADKEVVIERCNQEFFIKNITDYSYNVKVVSQHDDVTIMTQPNVVHPTASRAFSIEYKPLKVVDLDGLLHFEITPI